MSYRIVTSKLTFAHTNIISMVSDKIFHHTGLRFRAFNEEKVKGKNEVSVQLARSIFNANINDVEIILKKSAQKILELIDQYAVKVEGDLILNVHTINDNFELTPAGPAFAFV